MKSPTAGSDVVAKRALRLRRKAKGPHSRARRRIQPFFGQPLLRTIEEPRRGLDEPIHCAERPYNRPLSHRTRLKPATRISRRMHMGGRNGDDADRLILDDMTIQHWHL